MATGAALLALVLLAGCLGQPGGASPTLDAARITVTPLADAAPAAETGHATVVSDSAENAAAAADGQADAPEAEVAETAPEPPPDPATAACRASGGQMVPGPAGQGRLCVHRTPDSGRACTSAGDCTSACLSRSRTCAPVTPLLGCHEILDRAGRTMRQCIE